MINVILQWHTPYEITTFHFLDEASLDRWFSHPECNAYDHDVQSVLIVGL